MHNLCMSSEISCSWCCQGNVGVWILCNIDEQNFFWTIFEFVQNAEFCNFVSFRNMIKIVNMSREDCLWTSQLEPTWHIKLSFRNITSSLFLKKKIELEFHAMLVKKILNGPSLSLCKLKSCNGSCKIVLCFVLPWS